LLLTLYEIFFRIKNSGLISLVDRILKKIMSIGNQAYRIIILPGGKELGEARITEFLFLIT